MTLKEMNIFKALDANIVSTIKIITVRAIGSIPRNLHVHSPSENMII